MFIVTLCLIALWAAYSLSAAFSPLKPFSSRRKAAMSFGLSTLALFAVAATSHF